MTYLGQVIFLNLRTVKNAQYRTAKCRKRLIVKTTALVGFCYQPIRYWSFVNLRFNKSDNSNCCNNFIYMALLSTNCPMRLTVFI